MTHDHGAQGDAISAYYPDVIETSDDSPVLLGHLLPGSLVPGDGPAGLRVVKIDGCDTSATAQTELPGIRVGDGDGSGYIFRRALDSQFVFVPDLSYSGITTFTYTIADDAGDEATVVATVSVQPTALVENQITFTNGALSAGVVEGMDAAILGAIAFNGEFQGRELEFRVFEGGTDSPSQRFAVTGDTLRALERLDSAADSTIILKVAAYEGDRLVATTELAIEVHPAGARESVSAGDGIKPLEAAAAASSDQFHFMPEMNSVFETATVVAFRAPVETGEEPDMDPVVGGDDTSVDGVGKAEAAPPEGGDWFGI